MHRWRRPDLAGRKRHGKAWHYFREQSTGTFFRSRTCWLRGGVWWLSRRLSPEPFARYWVWDVHLFALAGFDDFFRLH